MTFNSLEGDPKAAYRRSFKSPIFSFSNSGTVLAGAKFLIDYHRDNTATEKYGSFNNLRVFNGSSVTIIVYPNQDTSQGIPIAAGTDLIADARVLPSTTSLLIENADSSNSFTQNQIRVQIWKDDTEFQNIVSRMHEKFTSREPSWAVIKEFLAGTKKIGGAV